MLMGYLSHILTGTLPTGTSPDTTGWCQGYSGRNESVVASCNQLGSTSVGGGIWNNIRNIQS